MSYVFLNGRIVAEKEAKVPVTDHGFLYGDGIYETLRTFNGNIWQVREHLRRLRGSAKLLGLNIPWNDADLKSWLERVVSKNGFKESRIRLTVTRGSNYFDFGMAKNPTILIQVAELHSEKNDILKKGVKVITVNVARVLPQSKSLSLLPMVLVMRECAKKNAYEGLFVDDRGYVLEGSRTNIFMVKKGTVYTPRDNILSGTTRSFIMKLAKRNGIKVVEKGVKLADLYGADELFITNAPKGIVPVRQVDGKKIGEPGKVTLMLLDHYLQYVKQIR